MAKPSIVVTGANGQLGKEIRDLSAQYEKFHFVFLSKDDLPIHEPDKVKDCFETLRPQYCINCAAYTAVDKAETEQQAAMLTNGDAPGILAAACKLYNTRFIHISTDYVFDGAATVPYREDYITNPVNYYGATKLAGEKSCLQNNNLSIIIRTSWVYSVYGNNFLKTMMRLMKERTSLNIVNDQLGSPTAAADLATVILFIIEKTELNATAWVAGIYHYSNDGIISWYDFAVAIKTFSASSCVINPIPTTAYPTPAKRPAYSVLDKDKIESTWRLSVKDWKSSLSVVVRLMQERKENN